MDSGGIGKSFVIQQLAIKDYYIVHANLARGKLATYPSRSRVADSIARLDNREDATVFFKRYIRIIEKLKARGDYRAISRLNCKQLTGPVHD